MPSYDFLFADGRGADLVAYLGSLGRTGLDACLESRAAWTLPGDVSAGDPDRGRQSFAVHCASCHGDSGRGNGVLAPRLGGETVADLTRPLRWVPRGSDETSEIARIVRFGLPGTSMPGHELFDDREIVDLAAWVRELGRRGDTRRASVGDHASGPADRGAEG